MFKTLEQSTEPDEWKREVEVYNRLVNLCEDSNDASTNPFRYIVRYLGSFSQPREEAHPQIPSEQRKAYTIILEYVNGGTLEAFFKTKLSLIQTPEDRRGLWQHMFDLLQGVHIIHNLGKDWKG